MKKYIVSIIFLVLASPVFAQSVFDQFEGIETVSAININKKMFELMSKVKLETSDKETLQYMSLIKKIDNLKVYRTQNERIAMQMRLTSEKYIKAIGLSELMAINDGGKMVRIHSKQGSSETQLKELLLFIEDPKTKETVLMSIIGDFDLNEVPALTDKMKIPGSAELRKAGKK
ncbi:DUF4252 domain-containing protein [Flavobacterium ammonificans]|uniref:DUF4252 domain-containing protein n=1 Tax=Flavobacterium ammonificans TaxID=1751056 RepID=UPI001E3F0556|nr:DUF4252 domain-containing protein [Flavobacterium ammonificans]BDB56929.1 hypothetical protein SHINM13_12250 [Flavobacterium ammonificans]